MSSFERNPYVGPRSIQRGEPLYGRSREVRELFNRLQARRIVVLHSPSGAGKSSLVQAGLIPMLEQAGFDVWTPIRVNLDPRTLEGVDATVNRYLFSAMSSLEEELPPAHQRSSAALAALDLPTYLDTRPRRKRRQDRPVVLLFDQFEEVLTAAPTAVEAKREFFTVVGQALESGNYWALFIIREDYLAALAPYEDRIPTQLSNTFRLDLLGLEGAREAAKQPALAGGRTFPAVERLVLDLATTAVQQPDGSFVRQPGPYVEPVQLQVVCRRLWDAMPPDDDSIDLEDIEQYASVSESLAAYYAAAVEHAAEGDTTLERAIREWVGDKLIVGGIRSQVRRGAKHSAGLDNAAIDRLASSYLVRTESRAGSSWFELSHDRLVEPVLDDNEVWEREHLHPLQVQAKLWESGRRAPGLLLSEEALAEATAWAASNPERLTEDEREFLRLSQQLRAQERRARRRLRALAVGSVVVALIVVGLGALAWDQRNEARRAMLEAQAAKDEAEAAEDEARRARELGRRASAIAGAWDLSRRGELGAAALLLSEVDEPESVRGWAEVALELLREPIPSTVLRHQDHVAFVEWSPDGSRIATASRDDTARIWSADGRGEPIVLAGHVDELWRVRWSPDGRRVLTTSKDGSARVWDLDGEPSAQTFRGHEDAILHAAWSPDGARFVTTSKDGSARVWTLDGADPLVLDHGARVSWAAWRPDGEALVTTTSEGQVQVWTADGEATGQVLTLVRPDGQENLASHASWSPDGTRVAIAAGKGMAYVWRPQEEPPLALVGHVDTKTVRRARWSPDGARVVTASDDGSARIWTPDDPSQPPLVLDGHTGSVYEAIWSPDGTKVVTVSFDKMARVWATDGPGEPLVFGGHEGLIGHVAWSPDGSRFVTSSADGSARIWAAGGPTQAIAFEDHQDALTDVAWSPDGARIATASRDESVRIWPAAGGPALRVLRDRDPDALLDEALAKQRGAYHKKVAWSPDGARVVTTTIDGRALVWAVDGADQGVILGGERGHTAAVMHAEWSPDGQRIVTTSNDARALVWAADGSAAPVELAGHTDAVLHAAWSPDGQRIITASKDESARIWAADGSAEPIVLDGHDGWIWYVSWSPDGRRVATASRDKTARLWSAEPEHAGDRVELILAEHEDTVRHADWSPDGQLIVTAANDRRARVWSTSMQRDPITVVGHDGWIWHAIWSPSGTHVVTVSKDNTAKVWWADGRMEPLTLEGHDETVFAAAWSPDSTRVVTASKDGSARVWLVDVPLLQAAVRGLTNDCLGVGRRRDYLLETTDEARAGFQACARAHGRERVPGELEVSIVELAVEPPIEDVRMLMSGSQSGVRYESNRCYHEALLDDPSIAGLMVIELTIGEDGRGHELSFPDPGDAGVTSAELQACVATAFGRERLASEFAGRQLHLGLEFGWD